MRLPLVDRATSRWRHKRFAQQLRTKWQEVPATRMDRKFSNNLLDLGDDELLEYWETCRRETSVGDPGYKIRGWYQDRYAATLAGRSVCDFGCGLGIDGIHFASHGAHVTFADIVPTNLTVVERICRLKRIQANFYLIDDFFRMRFERMFDVFLFIGSMHNAPFDFAQREVKALLPFLNVPGKVLMLAYPRERYELSGAASFAEFGRMTDGERTPWCEWYDANKVLALLGPGFKLDYTTIFGASPFEFNWFEVTRYSK